MTLCNLQIHWLYISLLFFLCSTACFFFTRGNPPNKCAKMTRQINPPKWPAKMSCHENLPDPPARITRRIYLPEKPAISTRGLLARDPPFPAQNPQAGHGSPTLPPPRLRQRSGGRGQGAGPAHPRILNRYFSFLMNGYIFLYNTIHTYSTQSGLNEV